MKKAIKIVLLVVLFSVSFTACTFGDAYNNRDNSSYESISSVSSQEEQTSNLTTAESNVESSIPSKAESSFESSTSNIEINKKDLDDWGDFDSVHKLRTKLKRNLENPRHVLATVEGLVVRADNGSDIYIMDEPEDSLKWLKLKAQENLSASKMLECADDYVKISMKDDTKNRVLTGDYIKLTGILNTSEFQFFDSEYKMIKAVE